MLKGVGEQVYSMWVNISDSLISIVLVWTLIPRLGILGYAIAIIGMEAYNFTLSALRLHRRIGFKINLPRAFILPACLATAAALLSRGVFTMSGSATTPFWLVMKMLFALCLFIAMSIVADVLRGFKKSRKFAGKVDFT
jgi:O-antigen/teichoic acid export membrane protein